MNNIVEVLFAFVLVPVYLAVCVQMTRRVPALARSAIAAFAVNFAIAAVCFGAYASAFGLAAGNWIGVSLSSGVVAAAIATGLAFRNRAAHPAA